jgi:hypothetical protein
LIWANIGAKKFYGNVLAIFSQKQQTNYPILLDLKYANLDRKLNTNQDGRISTFYLIHIPFINRRIVQKDEKSSI